MITRRIAYLGLLAAGALLLTACSSGGGGGSTPPSSTAGGGSSGSSASGGNTMPNGAPKVANPLQATTFTKNPCKSLTAQQARAIGEDTTPKPEKSDSFGSGCMWPYGNANIRIDVNWQTNPSGSGSPNGLDYYYAHKSDSSVTDYFQSTTVSGYPAVFEGPAIDKSGGSCGIAVGVSDDLVFAVAYGGDVTMSYDQACSKATQLANDILSNVKAGR